MKINLVNINDIIFYSDFLYAHKTKESTETLLEHSERTLKVFFKEDSIKHITDNLKKMFLNFKLDYNNNTYFLSTKDIDFLLDIFVNAIYLHDLGKINPKFQLLKFNNDINTFVKNSTIDNSIIDSFHSKLSMYIFLDIFLEKIEQKNFNSMKKCFFIYVLFSFANTIYSHHTKLHKLKEVLSKENIDATLSEFENNKQYLCLYKRNLNINSKYSSILELIKKIKFDFISIYILTKILYASIVECDFIATYCFYEKVDINNFNFNNITNIETLKKMRNFSDIFQGINNYKNNPNYYKAKNEPINELRSNILLETLETIIKNKNKKIFTLKTPTGGGKTNIGTSCALELLNNNSKLLYVLPINTIATQTKKFLNQVFKGTLEVQEINSIAPLPITNTYNKVLLDRQILNYESIVTSNIALFNLLFSPNRNHNLGLLSLFNSTIILDEIQNYKNSIWKETIEFLYKYSEVMNIKIIMMSATLPNLEELLEVKNREFVSLVKNHRKYYSNNLFKDRVLIDDSLLKESHMTFDILYETLNKSIKNFHNNNNINAKVIIEFITKKTALNFKRYLTEKKSNYNVMFLTGDTNNFKKEEIINYLNTIKKPKKDIILITTQVVEAGVDIDMDIGFKDSAFPDVDEQFLGRINRSALKKNCVAYFFNLDNESYVYHNDYRINTNIKNKIFFNILKNKTFEDFYSKIFSRLIKAKYIIVNSQYKLFTEKIIEQNFDSIYKDMQLIDNETFQIFIPIQFKNLNGIDVWNKYISLLENNILPYAEKRVRIINIQSQINFFTFSIYGKGIRDIDPVGGYYFLYDGIKFLDDDGTFDKELFEKKYTIEK